MKELGTLFLIGCVGAIVWCFLPLLASKTPEPKENMQRAQPALVDYHTIAREDAEQTGIDPVLFGRQIQQESGFQTQVVSPAGAVGIAQIMPATARAWQVDPWDANESLEAAAKAMSFYVHKYGGYEEALACYNAGCSALLSAKARCGSFWRACLPTETQNYIRIIMR